MSHRSALYSFSLVASFTSCGRFSRRFSVAWLAAEGFAIWKSSVLLDHLMCAQQQRRRNREAEFLRRLEVDDQVDLRGALDRQLAGARPLQNAIQKSGR